MTAPPTTRTPLVYRPESAVFWLFVIALATGALLLVTGPGAAMYETLDAQLTLAPIWLAFAVALAWLILRFDPFRSVRGYPQGLVAATAMGATTSVVMSMHGNGAMGDVLARILDPDALTRWSAALTAPVVEESAKGMCAAVILVLCSSAFHRISHALMVGMFVGFGFDLSEDLFYATMGALRSLDSDVAGASGDLGVRIFTAVPSHWAYTSLVAVGILLLLPSFSERAGWPRGRRILFAALLFLSSWLMHFLWDAPSPEGLLGFALLLAKVAVNLAIVLGWTLWLLRFERRWVSERIAERRDPLPPDLADTLTTRRGRRALQKAARATGGRSAAHAVRTRQRRALDELQSGQYPVASGDVPSLR